MDAAAAAAAAESLLVPLPPPSCLEIVLFSTSSLTRHPTRRRLPDSAFYFSFRRAHADMHRDANGEKNGEKESSPPESLSSNSAERRGKCSYHYASSPPLSPTLAPAPRPTPLSNRISTVFGPQWLCDVGGYITKQ